MKKIKQIKDIQYEKMRLQLKQIELEKKISRKWDSLKDVFSIKNIKVEKSDISFKEKQSDDSFLTTMINFGSGYLSRHLSQKAGQQLELTLQKGAHKLVQKLKTGFKRGK